MTFLAIETPSPALVGSTFRGEHSTQQLPELRIPVIVISQSS
jgi:hypothetical protein